MALALGFSGPPDELARLGQRAEQVASGVPCGLMDQLTSACGIEGHALLVDFADESVVPVPVPDDVAIVVVHSGQERALAGSAYAERRAACEAAAAIVGPLRDAAPDPPGPPDQPALLDRSRLLDRADALDSLSSIADGSPATSSAKWRPWRESRKSRTPSGEAVVTSAIRREAISQAFAGSAAGSFSMRLMVPQKPQSRLALGRVVILVSALDAADIQGSAPR